MQFIEFKPKRPGEFAGIQLAQFWPRLVMTKKSDCGNVNIVVFF